MPSPLHQLPLTPEERRRRLARGGTRSGKLPEEKHDDRLPPPGSVLTCQYKGGAVQVKVLPRGFEYAGAVYGSLSAVAKAVNSIEPKRVHGKRAVVEPDRKPTAEELRDRVHDYYGCPKHPITEGSGLSPH